MATEEMIVVVGPVTGAAVTEVAEGGGDVADKKVEKSTKVKEPKAKKPTGRRKPLSHPSYLEMITDAIVTLKEKTGSSVPAIAKFNEEKHKQLPSNFRKLLSLQLKKLAVARKLVKVKSSYKLPAATSTTLAAPKAAASSLKVKKPAVKPKPTAKPKETKMKHAAAKPKSAASKPKPKATVTSATAKTKAPATAKSKKGVTKAKAQIAPAAKPKPVIAKAKPAPRPKPKERPAKVSRTTAQSSPGKKAASGSKKVAPVAKKASPAKAVAKSPAKRSSTRRAKN